MFGFDKGARRLSGIFIKTSSSQSANVLAGSEFLIIDLLMLLLLCDEEICTPFCSVKKLSGSILNVGFMTCFEITDEIFCFLDADNLLAYDLRESGFLCPDILMTCLPSSAWIILFP